MKPASHVNITELALNIYLDGNQSQLGNAIERSGFKAIVRGARVEDNISLARATNWHFYPANEALDGYERVFWPFVWIVVKPTSETIMKNRQTQLYSRIKDGCSRKLFSIFGRVLHHIQDMSTPAHVVPVYHDPCRMDQFEDFLEKSWLELAQRINKKRARLITAPDGLSGDFVDLYHKGATRLLNSLGPDGLPFPVTIDNQQQTGSAELLWQPYDHSEIQEGKRAPFNIPGFGVFGPVGQMFGSLHPFVVDGHTYQVNLESYLTIAEKFVADAVSDTLSALRLFEDLIELGFKGRTFLV